MNRIKLLFVGFLFLTLSVRAQYVSRPDTLYKNRLRTTLITSGALYGATMTTLWFLWYADYPHSGFHWINDNSGWLQIDKAGHATTVYVSSGYMYDALRWSGVSNTKATLYGVLAGWGFLTTVEVMDGFSAEWGASWGDVIANTAGAALFVSQQLLWKEQRIRLKFSYFPTDYAQYRPDLLGENHLQRIIKDYNGQTYWLSANIYSFLHRDSGFPKWLNVAAGYGGKGMLGAASNPDEHNGQPLPKYNRVRQYYLSVDIDWTRIKTDSHVMRTVFKVLSFVKLPFPALEYNSEDGIKGHWLYF
jgi:hypothetical protein